MRTESRGGGLVGLGDQGLADGGLVGLAVVGLVGEGALVVDGDLGDGGADAGPGEVAVLDGALEDGLEG